MHRFVVVGIALRQQVSLRVGRGQGLAPWAAFRAPREQALKSAPTGPRAMSAYRRILGTFFIGTTIFNQVLDS